jgi:hypothetical protein
MNYSFNHIGFPFVTLDTSLYSLSYCHPIDGCCVSLSCVDVILQTSKNVFDASDSFFHEWDVKRFKIMIAVNVVSCTKTKLFVPSKSHVIENDSH